MSLDGYVKKSALLRKLQAVDLIEIGRTIPYQNFVDSLKTEDVRPAHKGRWIRKDSNNSKCSECNLTIRASDASKFKYCWRCGAVMGGNKSGKRYD